MCFCMRSCLSRPGLLFDTDRVSRLRVVFQRVVLLGSQGPSKVLVPLPTSPLQEKRLETNVVSDEVEDAAPMQVVFAELSSPAPNNRDCHL